jgi:hypothetical protein
MKILAEPLILPSSVTGRLFSVLCHWSIFFRLPLFGSKKKLFHGHRQLSVDIFVIKFAVLGLKKATKGIFRISNIFELEQEKLFI